MEILQTLIMIVLALVAVVHALWGIGYWFPIRDERKLVRTVVGAMDATRMPGAIPCAMVAAGLIIVVAALSADKSWVRLTILGAAAVVFFVRGALPWVPMWRRMTPQEPYATLDRRLYGPTCLLLGIGIATLMGT